MAVSLQLPSFFIAFQFPLLYLNNIVALAVKPKHQFLRVAISFSVLVLLTAQSWYRQWYIGWGFRYAMEVLTWCIWLDWIDWILLQSPDKEGWYKIQYGKHSEQEAEKEKDETAKGKMNGNGKVPARKRYETLPGGAGTTFWSRLWWAARLAITNRYVGWSCQVKGVIMEVPPDYPRLRWLARKTLRLIILYICNDIVICYAAASPYGTFIDLHESGQKFAQPLTADVPFHIRFWYTWVQNIISVVNLEMCHTLYGIVSVALGLANPRDCPSGFGRLRDLWSVRQAWSAVWHQQLRRICSTPSLWFARNVLGLKKGTFASKYVQLFGTFACSGAVHSLAVMVIHHSFDDAGAWRFFLGQAAIIFVEDHVIALGKKLGFRDAVGWRVLGFLWTVLMFGWGWEGHFREMTKRGVWIHERSPDFFGIGPKRV